MLLPISYLLLRVQLFICWCFTIYLIYPYCLYFHCLSSVQFSCPVVSNSLWPHELQHSRFPYSCFIMNIFIWSIFHCTYPQECILISDGPHHFFQSVDCWSLAICSPVHRHLCVPALSPSDNPRDIYKGGWWWEGTGQQRWSAANKWKMIMLEMKFKSNENQVIKEIAKHGNADMSIIQEILDKQWRNSVKVNLLCT